MEDFSILWFCYSHNSRSSLFWVWSGCSFTSLSISTCHFFGLICFLGTRRQPHTRHFDAPNLVVTQNGEIAEEARYDGLYASLRKNKTDRSPPRSLWISYGLSISIQKQSKGRQSVVFDGNKAYRPKTVTKIIPNLKTKQHCRKTLIE